MTNMATWEETLVAPGALRALFKWDHSNNVYLMVTGTQQIYQLDHSFSLPK